ncbi:MAG: VOC family protein [Candidatus Pelagibacter sp.]
MIGYVMVGTNDLDQSIKFYDELLKVLDLERTEKDDVCAGYSQKNNNGKIEFYVTKPFNKEKATVGNGSQISFQTSSRELVDKFHDVGIKLGGASEGSGGERPEGSGVYYSYIRDLDGNKICAFTNIQ